MLMSIAHSFDYARGGLLRRALGVPLFHRVFFDRSSRLAVLFSLAASLALVTSLLFPLWVLVIGPMVYGFPHLLATFRYFSVVVSDSSPDLANSSKLKISRQRLLLGVVTLGYLVLATLRVFEDLNGNQDVYLPQSFLVVEIAIALTLVVLGLTLTRASTRRWFRCLVVMTPFLLVAWYQPLRFAGAMVLIHNAIAFVYWVVVAKTRREKQVALIAGATFGLITVAIFGGFFDPVHKYFVPTFELPWADLRYWEIGKQIAPGEETYSLWFHCVVAYAFGQSLHYFVWLKAIPDQCHQRNVPTTFQASLTLLKRDYGSLFFLVAVFAVGGLGVWLLNAQPLARLIYFAFAAYHGYVEVAGLALASNKWAG